MSARIRNTCLPKILVPHTYRLGLPYFNDFFQFGYCVVVRDVRAIWNGENISHDRHRRAVTTL